MSTATARKPSRLRPAQKARGRKNGSRRAHVTAARQKQISQKWARGHLAWLKSVYPEPVKGASAVLEEIRADRF